jgi:hypothetical protein
MPTATPERHSFKMSACIFSSRPAVLGRERKLREVQSAGTLLRSACDPERTLEKS